MKKAKEKVKFLKEDCHVQTPTVPTQNGGSKQPRIGQQILTGAKPGLGVAIKPGHPLFATTVTHIPSGIYASEYRFPTYRNIEICFDQLRPAVEAWIEECGFNKEQEDD